MSQGDIFGGFPPETAPCGDCRKWQICPECRASIDEAVRLYAAGVPVVAGKNWWGGEELL